VNLGQSRLFNGTDPNVQELLDNAAAELARWETSGIEMLTVLDSRYPNNLRAVHDRPPFVFLAGALGRRDARSVAVVGSRRASRAGLLAARAIAEHLAARAYTVVSGLAAGIDTAAHTAALASGGRTVAVIGTGLQRCYPPVNRELQTRIACAGAVVSQFRPEQGPTRDGFPARNAVMSGLSRATVIVEATRASGARGQARMALAHARPVFVREPLLEQQWARELASKPGTHVFDSPSEITDTLERLQAGALVV
jgi:DNA processing protein